MRTPRYATVGLVVTALVCGAGFTPLSWSGNAGRPGTEEEARRQAADARLEALRRRLAFKDGIAADLVEGRMTLFEAAVRYAELDRDQPLYWAARRQQWPGVADEELTCLVVIDMVELRLSRDPARREAVVGRLKEELRLRKQRDGVIRLR